MQQTREAKSAGNAAIRTKEGNELFNPEIEEFYNFPIFFCKFPEKILHFSEISSDSRQILRFSKNFGEIPRKFHRILASKRQNSIKKCRKMNYSLFIFEKSLASFNQNFEFGAVRRCDYFVDLEKSCKMSIWSQKSALIQPRKSLSKFWGI